MTFPRKKRADERSRSRLVVLIAGAAAHIAAGVGVAVRRAAGIGAEGFDRIVDPGLGNRLANAREVGVVVARMIVAVARVHLAQANLQDTAAGRVEAMLGVPRQHRRRPVLMKAP